MSLPISRAGIGGVDHRPTTPDVKSETQSGRPKSSRLSASGMLCDLKHMARSMIGRSSLPMASAPLPSIASNGAAPLPSAFPHDPVGEAVAWIKEQNTRFDAKPAVIRKLTPEQARREGKPVPNRAAPPPPVAPGVRRQGGAYAATGGVVRKLTPEQARREGKPVPNRAAPPPSTAAATGSHVARAVSSQAKPAAPRYVRRPFVPMEALAEQNHESGPLASMGQHYEALWHSLRGSITDATRAGDSLGKTPRRMLPAKRAELQAHATELKHLIDESAMAQTDAATVAKLKGSGEVQRDQAVLVDRDIAETLRQRTHAQRTLNALEKAIASLPG
ncbi:hypothetical protein R69746_08366 [Paraburkholderia aspalathi]|uniref:hypothetical protein n=1 Tax=Paraburkholderia aspalathi TaxID=1324617 RepID=UPI001909F8BA|nr:hypothetical protein [Paraburkholderia aspalathi]MBK3844271.1 hypothetical protein [Paraburkholderia aspalathi]CAE6870263.1 hypothetical protein R69746_08366 [Paraburkholderia aspalathi]